MINKRIKYIVSYDLQKNQSENRVNVLASSNKIDYIVKILNIIGYKVDLISTSQTLNRHFYRGKKIELANGNTLKLFPTAPRGGICAKAFNVLYMRIFEIFYLCKEIKKNDIVVIYHSYGNMWMIKLLKKMKAKVVEEVEEIFGDIFGNSRMSKREKKLLQGADAYIYPTYLLNQLVNSSACPFVIVHGSYELPDTTTFRDLSNGDIRVGYTGTFDPRKGCLDVIRSAEYLKKRFQIHIAGFGDKKEINVLLRCMDEVRRKAGCQVFYDGKKEGKKYDEYLASLDIGICPIDNSKRYANTQFPSKIISYLSSGLKVVCGEFDAVKTSDVANSLYYYKNSGPKNIAEAINSAADDLYSKDGRAVISRCNKKFITELWKFIKNLEKRDLGKENEYK